MRTPCHESATARLLKAWLHLVFCVCLSLGGVRELWADNWSTFAGSLNGAGSNDGPVALARFASPGGIAVDAGGTLYVASSTSHTIRKITPAGVVTTFAGAPSVSGAVDGVAGAARFYNPKGIAIDASGTLYVCDTNNHTIRKITPDGTVSTVAGIAGSPGSATGTKSIAQFSYPTGIAVDSSGKLYVADTGNHVIRTITISGGVTSVSPFVGKAGTTGSTNGSGISALFDAPTGVAVDSAGTVYVAGNNNNAIRRVTSAGSVTTLAGSGAAASLLGTGTAAAINHPQGITIDASGNLYVAETSGRLIRKVTTPGGVVSAVSGLANFVGTADGNGSGLFGDPTALCVDTGGNLYVADTANHAVRKITTAQVVSTVAGGGGLGYDDGVGTAARFNRPWGLAVGPKQEVYVADTFSHTIRRVAGDGTVSTFAGAAQISGALDGVSGTAARFSSPSGLAADTTGNVYVMDSGNYTLRRITSTGSVTTIAGSAGATGSSNGVGSLARFSRANGIAVQSGTVYIADTANHKIRKFIVSSGSVSTLAGTGVVGGLDGVSTVAQFNQPMAVAVDSVGNVFVADSANHKIRKVTTAGVVSTFAGSGVAGNADGSGVAATFTNPTGVYTDAADNLYVTSNYAVRKITKAGVVTTVAGVSGKIGSVDATGWSTRFGELGQIAVDAAGKLVVADQGNSRIRTGVLETGSLGITVQPSNAAVLPNSPVSLSVSASGLEPITYQWRKDGLVIVGATDPTLTLASAQFGDSGSYDVVVKNGTDTLASTPAVLTVDTVLPVAVTFDSHPADLSVVQGSAASFSAVVSGTAPITYQWRKGGVEIPGATSATYTIAAAQSSNAGTYDVVVKNLAGTRYSNIATLAVTSSVPSAPVITVQPVSQTVLPGISATFRVTASGYPALAYQWYSSKDNSRIIGATAATFTIPSVQAADAASYWVDVSNTVATVSSASVALTVGTLSSQVLGNWSTLAGAPGGAGAVDSGTASAAQFNYPQGIVFSGGSLYLADTNNHAIRKIGVAGDVSTLAGSLGFSGTLVSGTANASARFNFPQGIGADTAGNLYVADTQNHVVCKVSSGTVTVFAGSVGMSGSTNGIGTAARFNKPGSLGVDMAGNVYVLDLGNHVVRMITAGGTVSTFAGNPGSVGSTDGPVGAARFNSPMGLALDQAGNVYVADTGNRTVRRISAGTVSTCGTAGYSGYVDATGSAARFFKPTAIVFEPNTAKLIVADGQRLRSITPIVVSGSLFGQVSTLAGSSVAGAVDGLATAAQFYNPLGLAAGNGNVYVADTGNSVVRLVDPFSNVTTFSGSPTSGSVDNPGGSLARFHGPSAVASDAQGNVYVADTLNHTVRKVSSLGEVTTFAGSAGLAGALDGLGSGARFNAPQGVALDAAGNVYVADTGNNAIRRITSSGMVSTFAGLADPLTSGSNDGPAAAARFYGPRGVAVDALGNVYVTDGYNLTVRKIDTTGQVSTLAGLAGYAGFTDGPGSSARFGSLSSLAVGGDGSVALIDGHTIRRITPSGVVSTLAGSSMLWGGADGQGTAATFFGPQGIALDEAGSVYVSDTYNHLIRRVSATGLVTTVAGSAGVTGSSDGVPSVARFAFPSGICVDASGNLVVADQENSKIRLSALTSMPIAITVPPVSRAVKVGAAASFSVVAGGPGPFSYQWRRRGVTIPGATSASYTINAAQISDADTYDVVVSNGVVAATSPAATLNVSLLPPTPVTFYSPPKDTDAAIGSVATFSVNVSGTSPFTYQWRKDSVPLAGKTQSTLTIASVQATDAGKYDVVVSNPAGSYTSVSANLIISASKNAPVLSSQTSSLSVYEGYPATFQVGATGTGPLSYQWRKGGVNIPGATQSTYVIPAIQASDLGSYDVVVSNPYAASVSTAIPLQFKYAPPPSGTWSTLAGPAGAAGSLDHPSRLLAQFNYPRGMALDASGSLYIADAGNHTIRRITAAGSVTTIAGSVGFSGSNDGVATSVGGTLAAFNSPRGVALDTSGTLYIADTGNHTIRKITAAGVVSTLAGTVGVPGAIDGTGVGARFNQPSRLVLATGGSLYVADTGNHVIRRVTASGSVTTVAGLAGTPGNVDKAYGNARFNSPVGVALDAAGTLLYIADSGNKTIRTLTVSSGSVNTLAGNAGFLGKLDGYRTAALFTNPIDICSISGGTFAVADGSQIRSVTSAGTVTTLAGSGVNGAADAVGTAAQFFNVQGIAAVGGTLFVADSSNSTVRAVAVSGGTVSTYAGAGVPGSADGVAASARFRYPRGVAMDAKGNVFVADTSNHTIRLVTLSGAASTFAGLSGTAGILDGNGTNALFNAPQSVALDSGGNLYVADTGNHAIRVISPAGDVTTMAGSPGNSGSADGQGSAALFNSPGGVAVDPFDNVWIADTGNRVVRFMTPDGTVTTLAGSAGQSGYVDGTGVEARFSSPVAIASDPPSLVNVAAATPATPIPFGIYVSDGTAIRKIAGTVTLDSGSVSAGSVSLSTPVVPITVGTSSATLSVGTVSTFAGVQGLIGNRDDGTGIYAIFSGAQALATDADGNVYVADTFAHTIRKITPKGAVSTLAGTAWNTGSANGFGTNARFAYPSGICVDSRGNLVVSELDNCKLRFGLFADINPPTILTAPLDTTVQAGTSASISVTAVGTGTLTYQWTKAGVPIVGATSPVLVLNNAQVADAAVYGVVVSSPAAAVPVSGGTATLSVSTTPPTPVTITAQPLGDVVAPGKPFTLSVVATGTGPLRYQWRKNGLNLTGATKSVFQISTVKSTDAGGYSVVVTNAAGAVTSGTATLIVSAATKPELMLQPVAQSVYPGVGAVFSVVAVGAPPLTYQWRRGGVNVGTSSSSYVIPAAYVSDVGTYDVVVSNAIGSVTSNAVGLSLSSLPPPSGMWSTVAGVVGGAGGTDAIGSAARFAYPQGIAIDAANNLYVADTRNHVIRKISAAGAVTTLAGSLGASGNANGTGTAAQFSAPQGVAVDTTGNVYVADTGNQTIRKITPGGLVSTLAGYPLSWGVTDGQGPTVRFQTPTAVAVDATGNVFVADRDNHTIRKILPDGTSSTFAGFGANPGAVDGTGAGARFNQPAGLALDVAGNLYVAEMGNKTIRKITPAGVVTLIAGAFGYPGSNDGAGLGAARFLNPVAVSVNGAGTALYVADGNKVRYIDLTTGAVSTWAGSAISGAVDLAGGAAQFNSPSGLALTSSGDVYVADTGNCTIRKIGAGASVSTFAGVNTAGAADGIGNAARFHDPGGAASDAVGNLYIADAGNQCIRRVTVSGAVTTFAGSLGVSGYEDGPGVFARFNGPQGVAVDAQGTLYVADTKNHTVRKISAAGVVSTLAGVPGTAGSTDGVGRSALFNMPRGVAVDASGSVYVADSYNFTIRKISPTGDVSTLAGQAGYAGSVDGMGSSARFVSLTALAVDGAGTVYIADGSTIRTLLPSGLVTTLAGTPGSTASRDGTGSGALFVAPQALALDASGNVYVADAGAQLIRKVTPAGDVTTIAGGSGIAGSTEGMGSVARFAKPSGLAADANGNLYVVDSDNSKVRVGILRDTPLTIVSQPAALTRIAGQTASFSVSATGAAPLTYQWRKGGAVIPGATNPVYSIGAVAAADAGSYDVVVTSAINPAAGLTSNAASLVVNAGSFTPPSVLAAPTSSPVVQGSSVTFAVTAGGDAPLSYQWRKDKVSLGGATGQSLTIAATQASDFGFYDVIVSNPYGDTISSGTLLAAMPPSAKPAFATQPASQKVYAGVPVTFSAVMSGTAPFTYQWFKDGAVISGATSSSYTVPAAFAADVGAYKVVVKNAAEPAGVSSNDAVLVLDAVPPPVGIWTTLSGPAAGAGSVDSQTATSATFNYPYGIAFNAGTLFVADTNNHTIRRIAAGTVSTVAGLATSAGSLDGAGSLARFNSPQGVAVDASNGLVYVADTGNHIVRKVAANGTVSLFAGVAGTAGALDGLGGSARFNRPSSLVVDTAGNVFVSDSGNHVIRKITAGGTVTTFAGSLGVFGSSNNAQGSLASFNSPAGISIDGADNLYVADSGNRVIRKVTSTGSVTTVAGLAGNSGTTNGIGAAARFSNPVAVASDTAGNLLVLDGSVVRAVSSAGSVTTLSGSLTTGALDGSGTGAQFFNPRGIVMGNGGTAYVADSSNSIIRQVTAGGVVTTFAGSGNSGAVDSLTAAATRFHAPRGMVADTLGNVYLADTANHVIRKIDTSTGAASTFAGAFGGRGSVDGAAAQARFNAPEALAVDAFNNLYVADTGNQTIRKISGGTVTTFAGAALLSGTVDGSALNARFSSPRGIAVDADGAVFVADTGSFTIRRIASGTVATLAGSAGYSGGVDGAVSSARFDGPVAIAASPAVKGKLWVADGHTIRTVDASGKVATVAGVSGFAGAQDWTGAGARFSGPLSLVVDATDNAYVADTYNHCVRKVTASGVVTTVAGTLGITGSSEGYGPVARFAYPSGICLDALGNLYVADFDNHKVRKGARVNADLYFTAQPQGLTRSVGESGTLACSVAGTAPLLYQWRRNGLNLQGANAATLVLSALQMSDSGLYDVVVTNSVGTMFSDAATLTVLPALSFTLHPQNASAVVGGTATLSAQAQGTAPVAYQWYKDGALLAGQTGASLQISSVQAGDAGIYYVRATDGKTAAPGIPSATARLSVVRSALNFGGSADGSGDVEVFAGNLTFPTSIPGTQPPQAPSLLPSGRPLVWTQAFQIPASQFQSLVPPYYIDLTKKTLSGGSSAQGPITDSNGDIYKYTPGSGVGVTRKSSTSQKATFYADQTNRPFSSSAATNVSATGTTFYTFDPISLWVYSTPLVDIPPSTPSVPTGGSSTPVLTFNPPGRLLSLPAGGSGTLSFQSSSQVTYQWYRNGRSFGAGNSARGSITVSTPASSQDLYRLSVSAGSFSRNYLFSVIVSVPSPIADQPKGGNVAPGGQFTLWVAPNFSMGKSFSYQWYKDDVLLPGQTNPILNITSASGADQGDYYVLVTLGGASYRSALAPVTVSVDPLPPPLDSPPYFLTQPAGATVLQGGSVSLTVEAGSQGPVFYQWRKDKLSLPNANSKTLELRDVQLTDAGQYDVIVGNAAGSSTSLPATVQVGRPPSLAAGPDSVSVRPGGYALLSVVAGGSAPVSYQWRKDGVEISGADQASLEFNPVRQLDAGSYDVVVSKNGQSVASKVAVLTVDVAADPQLKIVTQPKTATVGVGALAGFAVSVTASSAVSYQWLKDGSEISGATGPVYSITTADLVDVADYQVVASTGAEILTSTIASLSVLTPVNIETQPQSVSLGLGKAAIFYVGASGAGALTYQWRKDGVNISGANAALYQINAAQASDVGVYDVLVSNAAGVVRSTGAQLLIGQTPALVSGPKGGELLLGGSLTLNVDAAGSNLTYQWLKDGYVLVGANTATLTLTNVNALATGRYEVIVSNEYGSLSPNPLADVVVNLPVTITRQPASAALKIGAGTVLSVEAAGTGPLRYQWRKDGVPIAGATTPTFELKNALATTAGQYDVVVTNVLGSVTSAPAFIGLNVPVSIVQQPASVSVLQGSSVTLSVGVTGSAPFVYEWYRWPASGAPVLVGGDAQLTFPYITPELAGTYSVQVTGGGSTVYSDKVSVSVSAGRGIAVLQQPADVLTNVGSNVFASAVIDPDTSEVVQTGYLLCMVSNGVVTPTAVSGVVAPSGSVQVPLRTLVGSAKYLLRFTRKYSDNAFFLAESQPFAVTLQDRDAVAGTYEATVLDQNTFSPLGDGAGSRGMLNVVVSKTGAVSGRLYFVEAPALTGAPAGKRAYTPVVRPFTGSFAPSATDPSKLVCAAVFGNALQQVRQSLALEIDLSANPPTLTGLVRDYVSLGAGNVATAGSGPCVRNVGSLVSGFATATGRYAFSAKASASSGLDNNAYLLVQVLASGRTLWSSRLTGYSGSGSAGLSASGVTKLSAPFYESRYSAGTSQMFSSALLGTLNWNLAWDGGWDLSLAGNALETQSSKLPGTRTLAGFVPTYSSASFDSGVSATGARALDFSDLSDCRWSASAFSSLFPAQNTLVLSSVDTLAGADGGFKWNVTVSPLGTVRAVGVTANGITPPPLLLRLDRIRGEWSGSYTSGGVRRMLNGAVLDGFGVRGRGWYESAGATGRWELSQ